MTNTAPEPRPDAPADLRLRAAVLDAIGQAVVAWDLAGDVMFANPAAAQLFGRPLDEMQKARIHDLLPPLRAVGDDATDITEIARRGEAWAGDARFARRDGETFVAAIEQRPLRGDHGELDGAVVVLSDTSEERLAENALRMRDQQLRTLMAYAPVIIWTVDRAGVMTYCEGAGLRSLGMSGGDFVGTSAFTHTSLSPFVADHHRRALAGETFSVVAAVGGRTFEVHYSPLRQPRGAITGAMALAIDVTPREVESRVTPFGDASLGRNLIDNMGHSVAMVDRTGIIVAVNQGWRQAMAKRAADHPIGDGVGMSYFEASRRANLFSEDTAGRLRRGIETILAGADEPFRHEYVEPALGDGHHDRWMLLLARPLPADRGGALIAHADVAEHRRIADLERRLRAATGNVRKRGQRLASAAYELRSPLAVIRGYLSTITEYHERLSAGEMVDLVARAEIAVTQLDRLVNDLLLLSRIDAGAFPASTKVVSLPEILTQALGQFRIAHPGREFAFRFSAGEASVRGDREQLREIARHLLDNAVRYSPDRTSIEVDVLTPGDGTVSVTVRDRGPGVPAAELERIFARFHRVRTAANATVAGAGLGLSVARAVVERHGGHIEASAAPGGGLAVTFTLPLAVRRGKR